MLEGQRAEGGRGTAREGGRRVEGRKNVLVVETAKMLRLVGATI